MDVDQEIAAYAAKLAEKDVTPRIKKRILQKLGKLKKLKEAGSGNVAQSNAPASSDSHVAKSQKTSTNTELDASAAGDRVQNDVGKKERKNLLHLLNKDLATFAVKKQADRAKLAVKQLVKKGVQLDTLTYSNLMNVYVRCHELSKATAVLTEMKALRVLPNIVTYTTLLKGYSESGLINDARTLFEEMLNSGEYNARSISTFLRGCVRVGRVDDALHAYQALSRDLGSSTGNRSLLASMQAGDGEMEDTDVSQEATCLEYTVQMLCQAGRIDAAEDLIREFLHRMEQNSQSMGSSSKEAHAIANAGLYALLARAALLQGSWTKASKFAKLALELLSVEDKVQLTHSMKRKFDALIDSEEGQGGVSGEQTSSGPSQSRSVQLFRQHRRSELRHLLETIEDYLSAVPKDEQVALRGLLDDVDASDRVSLSTTTAAASAAFCACLSKLLYFGFDGHSDLPSRAEGVSQEVFAALQQKFGLSSKLLAQHLAVDAQVTSDGSGILTELRKWARNWEDRALQHVSQSLPIPPTTTSSTTAHGQLQMRHLFHPEEDIDELIRAGVSEDIPVKLEIGSGNGDWVVAQAEADRITAPSAPVHHNRHRSASSAAASATPSESKSRGHWIALELRCDRVFNILANHLLTLRPLAQLSQGRASTFDDLYYQNNLAILGGDAVKIVQDRIPHNSISQVFINYPQPPERISGAGQGQSRNQGKHLLTKDFFHQLCCALKPGGTLTLLTDNLLYAQHLAQSLTEMISVSRKWVFVDVLSGDAGVQQSDGLWKVQEERTGDVKIARTGQTQKRSVTVWRGEPGPVAGHVAQVSSYFDRMWTMGQKKRRWFLFVQKEMLVGPEAMKDVDEENEGSGAAKALGVKRDDEDSDSDL